MRGILARVVVVWRNKDHQRVAGGLFSVGDPATVDRWYERGAVLGVILPARDQCRAS